MLTPLWVWGRGPRPANFLGAPLGRAELGQRGLGRPKTPLGPITKPNIYYCMVSILCNDYFEETECLTERLCQLKVMNLCYYITKDHATSRILIVMIIFNHSENELEFFKTILILET